MPLTDRELAILSVAVTQLQHSGFEPYKEAMIIQVALWIRLVAMLYVFCHSSCPLLPFSSDLYQFCIVL